MIWTGRDAKRGGLGLDLVHLIIPFPYHKINQPFDLRERRLGKQIVANGARNDSSSFLN